MLGTQPEHAAANVTALCIDIQQMDLHTHSYVDVMKLLFMWGKVIIL